MTMMMMIEEKKVEKERLQHNKYHQRFFFFFNMHLTAVNSFFNKKTGRKSFSKNVSVSIYKIAITSTRSG